MENESMLIVGLMSGTSADGIDVALTRVNGAPPKLETKLLAHTTLPMPANVRKGVLRVAAGGAISAGELSQLNFRLGQVFADAVLHACRKFRTPLERIDLIGSHGQTIFHQGEPVPFAGARVSSSLQIGEPAVIAARTGVTTIGDFRPADMAAGGQGAPLVPYVDYLLFRDSKKGRVALNLGGIGNMTVLPRAAKAPQVFAFDTGPGNMLIDALVAHFSHGKKRYDDNAQIARRGTTHFAILQELQKDPYLRLRPPKSTGREYYGRAYMEHLLALGKRFRAKPEDLIRAATVFTALSVIDALNRFVLPKVRVDELLVSGGGVHNPLIMAQLQAALTPISVIPSSKLGVHADAKEAYAFALLAYESWHRRAGNLPSATGASVPVVLGKICYAPCGKKR